MKQLSLPGTLLRWLTLSGLLLFIFSIQAMGQGCAQCLDSTQATPPTVQAAYRHAIELLGTTGALLFAGGVWVLRRNNRRIIVPYEQRD